MVMAWDPPYDCVSAIGGEADVLIVARIATLVRFSRPSGATPIHFARVQIHSVVLLEDVHGPIRSALWNMGSDDHPSLADSLAVGCLITLWQEQPSKGAFGGRTGAVHLDPCRIYLELLGQVLDGALGVTAVIEQADNRTGHRNLPLRRHLRQR